MDGFIFLNKEVGLTSREACDKVGRVLGIKKVGHIGTLDPFATGLLLIMINKATRCAQFFDEFDKGYIATISLGEERDSLDVTGQVINQKEVPNLSIEEVKKVLSSFLGKQKQIPPMTSAVHVNGKKLYEYAHKGVEVERNPRDIEILDIKLLSFSNDQITFYTKVSKGTYIRVLGSDIAKKLNTVGYLSSLERVGVGPFNIDDSIYLNEVNDKKIMPIYDVLSRFCAVKNVDPSFALDIKNGKIKYIKNVSNQKYLLVVEDNNKIVAMYTKINDDNYEFKRGLFE